MPTIPHIFATLPAGNVPASYLDDNFAVGGAYTPPGTGAVTTTVSAKLQQTISANDFGADPTGVTDSTAAFNNALAYLYSIGGGTLYVPTGNYLIKTSIALAWSAAIGINIQGAGKKATIFTKGTTDNNPVFDLSASGVGNGYYSTFRDFSIVGNNNLNHGIRTTLLARLEFHNIGISGCNVAQECVGSLLITHYNCDYQSNVIGIRTRLSGTTRCNVINVYSGSVNGNTSFGFDVGDCSNFSLIGIDIEANGTSVNTATGAMIYRSTCGNETGFGIFNIKDCWFESNLGMCIQTENFTAAVAMSIEDTIFINSESGNVFSSLSTALRSLSLARVVAGGTNDTVTVTAGSTNIQDSTIHTLTDGSTNHTYTNLVTSSGATPFVSGNSTVAMNIANGACNSGKGATTGVLNSTATTIFTLPAAAGMYVVYAYIASGGTSYMSNARIGSDGGSDYVRMGGENAANMTITISGANVQATQTSGGTTTVKWIYQMFA